MLGPGGKLDSAIRLAALLVATVAEGLAPYVDKVRRHAYEVTDADVSKLRSAGYTDDEIYELTVATAMGVGLNRFKVGLLWGMRPS